ncbi:hypothetical protein G6F46_003716 [Rhizopus delemar]|uniref:Uncharacterized protein n=2 Tax=Rhizopus TaxID=4842 RepID=A0A9P6ZCJ4_9FUNG|nr:hypothetical protein G6F55_001104 [Rhizopus delemar]KAG1547780.1 hypothetical protein G6F51_004060 [Rhizopus arrhizus]KAG1504081.1 hypothetical protein G6F54_001242 [Rhizopus delemar]KAG1517113.1 hypothetical protein G6F52_009301 [Rhizopus delemar]KAG1517797.1 hypothetical protein G6F53_001083 [Rhizopus delemar]
MNTFRSRPQYTFSYLPSYQQVLMEPPPPVYVKASSKRLKCYGRPYISDEDQRRWYHERQQERLLYEEEELTPNPRYYLKATLWIVLVVCCLFLLDKYLRSEYKRF